MTRRARILLVITLAFIALMGSAVLWYADQQRRNRIALQEMTEDFSKRQKKLMDEIQQAIDRNRSKSEASANKSATSQDASPPTPRQLGDLPQDMGRLRRAPATPAPKK